MTTAPRHIMPNQRPQPVVVSSFATQFMNTVALGLLGLMILIIAIILLWRGIHLPVFTLKSIILSGETTHSQVGHVRHQVLSQLRGNFFTIQLNDVQQAFAQQPWVRQAVVRRLFPNTLSVQLQEHQEVALWNNEAKGMRLISTDGIVFDANPDESEQENLPELSGPEHQAPQVLAVWRMLNPLFTPLDTHISRLSLDERGGWMLELEQNTTLALGQVGLEVLQQRVQQFVQTIAAVAARHNRDTHDVQYADLRYQTGYAVRLKGIGTLNESGKKPSKTR